MAYKDPHDERLKAARRKWYYANKEKQATYREARRDTLRKWLRASRVQCNRCSEDHPACLDYHHLDPSEKDIALAQAFHDGWSIERMQKEIEKCEVLCSNCHRKEHGSVLPG